MPSKRKLKIMFHAINGVGHVNACLSLIDQLLVRGHEIVFLVDKNCEKLLDNYSIDKVVLHGDCQDETIVKGNNPGAQMAQNLTNWGVLKKGTSYDKYKNTALNFSKVDKKKMLREEKAIKETLEKHRPDVLVQDKFSISPYIYYSDIPWVRLISNTPTFYDELEGIPPGGSGYPLDGDRKEWDKFRELTRLFFYSKDYNDVVQELGFERYLDDNIQPPKYALTLFGYPEELTYTGVFDYPDSWVNVESFMKQTNKVEKAFEIPESLEKVKERYPGKLIYLSLGSMCSADVELMKRFVSILSKTKHRYIVSKGPRHSEFELAENMWGDRYLPQTSILPVVDLVITHGGNNSFTETLVYGKPMIVFPVFVDQYDNAQRIVEVGLGRRLDPYEFEDYQLTNSIEELLNNCQIQQRLRKMSQRILSLDRFKTACDRIEALASKE